MVGNLFLFIISKRTKKRSAVEAKTELLTKSTTEKTKTTKRSHATITESTTPAEESEEPEVLLEITLSQFFEELVLMKNSLLVVASFGVCVCVCVDNPQTKNTSNQIRL